jgi:hypothetical protein
MWTVDAARFAVVGGLALAVLGDQASIALLAAVGFLLGTGQTLVDTGAQSILPALVSRDPQRLERANGRLIGTQVVTQELAGPPTGGFLCSVAGWVPFALVAVSFAVGSALVASIRGHVGPAAGDPAEGGRRTSLWTEIGEGLRWLDAVGFGLLLSGSAVGGVLGSLVAARLARVVGTAVIWTMVLSALAFWCSGSARTRGWPEPCSGWSGSSPWSSTWCSARCARPSPPTGSWAG